MTLPQIIVDLLTLLFDMAVPAAICTMVLAGIALRQEGGVNFQAGGRFQRWALWSVIFLTLPQLLSWFAAQGIAMPAQGGGISSSWVASLQTSLQRFRFERRGCPVDSRARRFLRAEGCARCGRGVQPARVHRLRHFSAVCIRHSPAFSELEQRVRVRNHGHADSGLELSRRDDPAGSGRIGDCGCDFQLRAPSAIHAAGGIGSCVLECFGHLEAGPGHGRLMRIGGDPVNLSNGLLNLTNWLGNVIMPTMAGLFAAAAIYRFSKGQQYQQLGYAALASLMCSGLLRVMESFSNQASWNNPDRYWISILTLVNWVGNVLLPLYGAGQVVLAVVHFAGLLERMTIGEAWVRNLVAAMCCFGLSGLLRLGEFWIQHGTAGVR
jgi:hypothetical protein